MKNIEFSSPETDRKILVALREVLIVVSVLAVASSVGYLLPALIDSDCASSIQYCDALVGVALLVFVWGLFHILEPTRRYSRKWAVAEVIGIPMVWLLLLSGLIWLQPLHKDFFDPAAIVRDIRSPD